jgi:hypothetical protein
MAIHLSEKSQKYITKHGVKNILIDVLFLEESCAEIYEPYIKVLKNAELEQFKELEKISKVNLTLYISKSFFELFGKLDNYQLDTSRIIRNRLILSNVEPIIKNTCRKD